MNKADQGGQQGQLDFNLETPVALVSKVSELASVGSAEDKEATGVNVSWIRRLSREERQRGASLCLDRRPLLFLVDERDHWHLIEPRLRLAGWDVWDIQELSAGEIRMQVPLDAADREVAFLHRIIRECRPRRALVTERLALVSLLLRESLLDDSLDLPLVKLDSGS